MMGAAEDGGVVAAIRAMKANDAPTTGGSPSGDAPALVVERRSGATVDAKGDAPRTPNTPHSPQQSPNDDKITQLVNKKVALLWNAHREEFAKDEMKKVEVGQGGVQLKVKEVDGDKINARDFNAEEVAAYFKMVASRQAYLQIKKERAVHLKVNADKEKEEAGGADKTKP